MATYDNQTCVSDCLLLEFYRSNKKANMKSLTVRYVHGLAGQLDNPECQQLADTVEKLGKIGGLFFRRMPKHSKLLTAMVM